MNLSTFPKLAALVAEGSLPDIVTVCLLTLDFAIESDAFLDVDLCRYPIEEIAHMQPRQKLLVAQILVDYLVANFTPETVEIAS